MYYLLSKQDKHRIKISWNVEGYSGIMSIAPTVLAQVGIMRKPHGVDRRHGIMSIAPTVLA